MEFQSRTALVTGASSGLGEEFARQLAASGTDLVLVARSEDKLNQIAAELRGQGKIQVTVLPADLASAEAVEGLIAGVKDRGIHVDILINNAGLGVFRNVLDTPSASQVEQIDVNVRAVVMLTQAFTPGMVAARRGGVINIASSAAFQPAPGAALYAASKAFVLYFSEALSFELAKSGVTVLAACPGPVSTNFFASMNPKIKSSQMDRPEAVVREILVAFEAKKQIVFPGKLKGWLGTFGARLLPRRTMLRLSAGIFRQLNQE